MIVPLETVTLHRHASGSCDAAFRPANRALGMLALTEGAAGSRSPAMLVMAAVIVGPAACPSSNRTGAPTVRR